MVYNFFKLFLIGLGSALLVNTIDGFVYNSINMCSKQNLRHNMQIDRRNLLGKGLVVVGSPLISKIGKIANAYTIDEENHISLFEKLSPSVCYISTEYKNIAGKFNMDIDSIPQGIGTGYVWDTKGHIVTNFHVINKVDKAIVTLVNKDGKEKDYVAKLTGVDPDKDIAVLKLDVLPLDKMPLLPIPLGTNKDIKIGQYAFAIGNPFGQDHTLTMGIISGKNREMVSPTGRKIKNIIQTDTPINPGNSGGPLVDSSGKLIAMNTATIGMGVSSGVNLAISIDMVKETVEEIIKDGMVQRAVLGISYLEKNPTRAEAAKSGIPYIEKGVIVLDVPETSPAYAAGLRGINNNSSNKSNGTKILGDVIIGIDQYPISKSSDFLEALDKYKPNDKIKLFVLRGQQRQGLIIDVVLASFALNTFSGIENEKNNTAIGFTIPLDIPLKNMAPKSTP
jgi:S1-C subfamily serine protease